MGTKSGYPGVERKFCRLVFANIVVQIFWGYLKLGESILRVIKMA